MTTSHKDCARGQGFWEGEVYHLTKGDVSMDLMDCSKPTPEGGLQPGD